jgi:hypothetical protein
MDNPAVLRMEICNEINRAVQSNSEDAERIRLEQEYGEVWDTGELTAGFTVEGFAAPFIVATRKSDGKRGTLMFQHHPRFYFSWAHL